MAGVVIIGGGYGGGETAIKLRQFGYTGAITLVSAESLPPYHRPPLSKAYLAGHADDASLMIRPSAAYDKADIALTLGTRAVAIDRARQMVRLDDGAEIAYAHLVLATGGEARPWPGAAPGDLFTLRRHGDALALRPYLAPGQRIVVIGGGYIGLEAAAVAVKAGASVTVLEAAPRLLARVAGPELAGFFMRLHRQNGVEIHTHAAVCAAGAGEVRLEDGRRFAADAVLVGIGLVPGTQLAEAAGLAVDNGILVDEHGCTSDPAILAVGDVARHYCPPLGRRVRLESVPNALEQARAAAAFIVGQPAPYAAVPWFWSDQYHVKLQSVGVPDGETEAVIRGDLTTNFVIFHVQNGDIVAADAVNRAADFMVAKRLVAQKIAVAPDALADETVPLKSWLPG